MRGERVQALLIGVEDYRAYDASAGLDAGTTDLRGAVNDVAAFRRTLVGLGVPEANVRVLCQPAAAAAAGMAGGHEGEATRAGIEAALDAFARRLDDEETRGLVLFCGHGDADARGSLLCPSDVTKGLSEALPFAEVAARLDRRRQQAGVAMFLDACHAAPRVTEREGLRRRTLRGQSELVPAARRLLRADDVLLSASAPGEPSHEYRLHGRWQGAFTWAVTSLLDRWGASRRGEGFAITWDELLRRTGGLLRELDVAQTPCFDGAERVKRHQVLGGKVARREATPNVEVVTREIPDGVDEYVIEGSGGTIIGHINLTEDKITWRWTSQTVAFPSTFKLRAGTQVNTSYAVDTERHTFSATAASYSMSGVEYKIKQNGSTVGYMDKQAGKHVWYSISQQSEYALADMEFVVNTDTGNVTLYRAIDAII